MESSTKTTPLNKKLGIKPGTALLVLSAPVGYVDLLKSLLVDTQIVQGTEPETYTQKADAVHLFARSAAEIAQYGPGALARLKPGGLLWICYPKKTAALKTDLSREVVWEAMQTSTGWRPVTQVAIDETWSALRFRPVKEVGKGH